MGAREREKKKPMGARKSDRSERENERSERESEGDNTDERERAREHWERGS
jgi:hypothetical protein